MLEGKACLAAGIQSFQYVSTTCLFEFFAILFLYYMRIDFSLGNYYLIDLFTIYPFTIIIAFFTARNVLTKQYPHSNIFNFEMMVSIFGHLIISFLLNIVSVKYYYTSPNYISALELMYPETEAMNTVYFITQTFGLSGVCSFGALYCALIFAKGWPFKWEWIQSIPFVIWLLINLFFQIVFLYGHDWFKGGFQTFVNEFYLLNFVPDYDV